MTGRASQLPTSCKTQRLNVLQTFFVGVSDTCQGESSTEKRVMATMAMATVSCIYILVLAVALEGQFLVAVTWIGNSWPWASDNPRSIMNPGFAYVLVFWLPASIIWWRIGRGCQASISLGPRNIFAVLLVSIWFFLNVVGALFLSIGLGYPLSAAVTQTLAIVAMGGWFGHVRRT